VSNHINDAFKIFKNLGIPEPDNAVAKSLKLVSTCVIAGEVFWFAMLAAIKFDNQSAAMAGKIGNISANWNLAAEMPVCVFEQSKLLPKLLLRISNVAAKLTSKLVSHLPTPTPNPSPQGGGGLNYICIPLPLVGRG